jgi:uncharacterized protein
MSQPWGHLYFNAFGDLELNPKAGLRFIDCTQGDRLYLMGHAEVIWEHKPTQENPMETKPPLPPFTLDTAKDKVQAAENAWNTRDPQKVALAYTEDSEWRNRSEFLTGRAAIEAFLTRKWAKEQDYRLRKELWCFMDNRIAVRFEYEWHDESGNWHRAYGNENWEFAENGLMMKRYASINDLAIQESDRKFRWER